jgi:Ca2+-binding RTX toxin-like protein
MFDLDALEADGIIVNDALAGNDLVTLSETQNVGEAFNGGNGRDSVFGSAWADNIFGGLGTDTFYGYGGNDILNGGNDTDRLYGGFGNDVLNGNTDRDFLYGEDDDDDLFGGDGGDFLYGGAGADDLYGGDHFDFLYGEDGNDTISGNVGDDLLVGGKGSDRLYGGRGRDTFTLTGAHMDGGADRIGDFERGADKVVLQDVLAANGAPLTSFADLDTSGDGVLDALDANIVLGPGTQLTLSFTGGTLMVASNVQLGAADFDFLIA